VEAIAAGDAAAARHYATDHILRGEQRLVEGGVISRRRPRATHKAPASVRKSKPPSIKKKT
jgi:GntR family transcriptional repressor for pyruvate dehydrogenase complex